LKRSVHS